MLLFVRLVPFAQSRAKQTRPQERRPMKRDYTLICSSGIDYAEPFVSVWTTSNVNYKNYIRNFTNAPVIAMPRIATPFYGPLLFDTTAFGTAEDAMQRPFFPHTIHYGEKPA